MPSQGRKQTLSNVDTRTVVSMISEGHGIMMLCLGKFTNGLIAIVVAFFAQTNQTYLDQYN